MLEVLLPVHGPEAQLSSSELCSNKEGSDSMDSEEAPQLAMEATGLPGGGPLFTIEVTEFFSIEATLPLLAMETTGLPRAGPLFTGEATEFSIEATLPLLAMETTGLPRAGPLFTGEATKLSSIEATVTLGLFGAGVP